MNINDIFEKLFNYFQTSTIRELSEKINMSESTVSKWRQRESVNAIKKKCRELGIYNEIFGDSHLNSNIQKIDQISGGNNSQLNCGNQINNVNNKISGVDKLTLDILIEAYQKAIKNDDLNGLRIHLMEYS
ncbi:hypothetical protein [Arcobacter porcinus]|uniref:Uncharacterized protein n=1 Tax=Arcobacter porcinus TaxID=1935204 RepID=A0A5C2HDP5_9BACT|nr:hypothetical protein [Arcobacter porcinus]OCL89451.1 hypothetical protein AAX27_01874 [Aliarcobacter thereius]QEP41063.1 hypothetical protein APORC_1480 [Arcobacter porcinus]